MDKSQVTRLKENDYIEITIKEDKKFYNQVVKKIDNSNLYKFKELNSLELYELKIDNALIVPKMNLLIWSHIPVYSREVTNIKIFKNEKEFKISELNYDLMIYKDDFKYLKNRLDELKTVISSKEIELKELNDD